MPRKRKKTSPRGKLKKKKLEAPPEEEDDDDSFLDENPLASRPKPVKYKYSLEKLLADHKKAKKKPKIQFPSLSSSSSEEVESDLEDEDVQKMEKRTLELEEESGDGSSVERKTLKIFSKQKNFSPRLPKKGILEKYSSETTSLFEEPEQEIIEGNWLCSCYNEMKTKYPTEILQWLFDIVAFDKQNCDQALQIWVSFLSKNDNSHMFATSPFGGYGNLKSSKEWIPTMEDFEKVFRAYGARIPKGYIQPYIRPRTLSPPPIENFTAIIFLLHLCIRYRYQLLFGVNENSGARNIEYTDDQLRKMLLWMIHFTLDSTLVPARQHIQSTISVILSNFIRIENVIPDLCKKMYEVAGTAKNQFLLARRIPPEGRGEQLRVWFSYYVLCEQLGLSNLKRDKFPSPEEIMEIIKTMIAEKSEDYEILEILVSLIDLCVNSSEISTKTQYSDLEKIKNSLITLNSQLRDMGSLTRTRIKDKLVVTTTRLTLTMYAKLAKNEQTKMDSFYKQEQLLEIMLERKICLQKFIQPVEELINYRLPCTIRLFHIV